MTPPTAAPRPSDDQSVPRPVREYPKPGPQLGRLTDPHPELAGFRQLIYDELTKQAIAQNTAAPDHWLAARMDGSEPATLMSVDEALTIDVDAVLTVLLDHAAAVLYDFATRSELPPVYILGAPSLEELRDGIVEVRRRAIEHAADELRITPRSA